jgi:hypothetical protein
MYEKSFITKDQETADRIVWLINNREHLRKYCYGVQTKQTYPSSPTDKHVSVDVHSTQKKVFEFIAGMVEYSGQCQSIKWRDANTPGSPDKPSS